jgi:hypothetical protein
MDPGKNPPVKKRKGLFIGKAFVCSHVEVSEKHDIPV